MKIGYCSKMMLQPGLVEARGSMLISFDMEKEKRLLLNYKTNKVITNK
jgi:hypothetical protein